MVLKMTGMRMQKTFFVPEEDRWSKISSAAYTPEIGTVVNDAMRAIEKENASLKNVLPKNYANPDWIKEYCKDYRCYTETFQ